MDIYQHFNKEEHRFVDKILEQIVWVVDHHSPKLLNFMTPREQEITASLVRRESSIFVIFSGATSEAERKRALIVPDYYQENNDDFSLTALRLTYSTKFATISHQNVLGTLMSLGIRREKFGDIYLQAGQIDMIVASEIADYITQHLDKINKAAVKVTSIPLNDVDPPTEEWAEKRITVSSLRLDAVVAEIARISRQKAQFMIEQGKVQINWKLTQIRSLEVKEDDLLSIRGIGRVRVLAVAGQSKKQKWRVVLGIAQ